MFQTVTFFSLKVKHQMAYIPLILFHLFPGPIALPATFKKPGEYFFKGEDLGELRDYHGNLLYTSIATENGVVLYQTASLNIIEDGPMIAYAAITETLT